ncbi:unnamed protein product [Orchesella dallaii]|uniref:Death domain-containing protein n=1 Tax=Orchesella dallaii TaxID=48710 RepID=A0ABP1R6Q6_9HEXA
MANPRWGDYLDSLVVGDEPCTFLKVRMVLSCSAGSSQLWSGLMDLATSLQIPDDQIQKLRTGLTTGLLTHPSALVEILQAWRAKFSSSATLSALISALVANRLTVCADSLRNQC